MRILKNWYLLLWLDGFQILKDFSIEIGSDGEGDGTPL